MSKPLKSFVSFGKHKHSLDKIAEINGFLSGIALFPQVVRTIITRDASSLSAFTFILIIMNSSIWFFYARHRSLPQLLLSSSLNFIAAGILLLLMWAS